MSPEERAELYKFVARNAATEVTAAKVLRCLHVIDEQRQRIAELEAVLTSLSASTKVETDGNQ